MLNGKYYVKWEKITVGRKDYSFHARVCKGFPRDT